MAMYFRLVLVVLLIQMWLWRTIILSKVRPFSWYNTTIHQLHYCVTALIMWLHWTGQCNSPMEVCVGEISTTVWCGDWVGQNNTECVEQEFTVVSQETNLTLCGAIVKSKGTLSNECRLQISNICLSTPQPTCAKPCAKPPTTLPTTSPPIDESSAIAGLLGTMVGLLVVLLALTNVGWMWTCYITKNRGKIIEHLNARWAIRFTYWLIKQYLHYSIGSAISTRSVILRTVEMIAVHPGIKAHHQYQHMRLSQITKQQSVQQS